MSNKIDFEGIYEKNIGINQEHGYKPIHKEEIFDCMKQAIRQALPVILEDVAENAEIGFEKYSDESFVDKQSILSRKDELIKKLGI